MFVAMEYELRQHIHQGQALNLEHITTTITENEDVLFLWSLVSTDWEDSSASALLQMVVNQWVFICQCLARKVQSCTEADYTKI